jgi:uncharacterized membrane protein
MKTVGKLMFKGLVAVLPIALTLYIMWWLGSGVEALLGGLLRRVLPERLYVPGLGLVLGAGLLIAMGSVMNAVVARRLTAALDGLMSRVPLVKTVYGSVRDLLSLFSKTAKERVDQVVLVRLTDSLRLLGLVTRAAVPELGVGEDKKDPLVAVYVPMSYGIGGYTVLAPRSALTPVGMKVEHALRFAITGGGTSGSR